MSDLRLLFDTANLPEEALLVHSFTGREAISQLYRFDLNLVSQDRAIDFADVVNQPATLTMQRGDETLRVHGLVADFEQGDPTADFAGYRAVLVPRAWLLTLTYRSRIFQRKTVEEIITQVLEEGGLASSAVRFELTGAYEAREYCVQYQESDAAFIARLMEHEGIFFLFEQGDDEETLVITDDRDQFPTIEGASTLAYHPQTDALTTGEDEEAVSAFRCRERIITGRVVLNDYNYREPDTDLEVEAEADDEGPGTRYEYGNHYKTPAEGGRLARVRSEEIACTRRVMTGQSNGLALRAGQTFTLEEHYRKDLDGDYLLTAVEHEGSQGAGLTTDEEAEPRYTNAFTCIPADAPYRPPRTTPVPRVPGLMTARIETGGGDYPYVDEDGRYHARMHFDRGDAETADATRPLRMAQPHSGPHYGIHFPHHADTELVWGCVNGDVDRPLAVGTVPNPNNTSPAVQDNNHQNVVRTKAGNQLILDDRIDEEQIWLNTPAENTVFLDDKDDRIQIYTTNRHVVVLDDKNGHVTVQTSGGHFLVMDDGEQQQKITLQSTDGHRLSIDDTGGKITMADASGDNFFQIDAGSQKLTIKSANGDIDMLAPNGHINIKAQTMHLGTSGNTTQRASNITSNVDQNYAITAGGEFSVSATSMISMETDEFFDVTSMGSASLMGILEVYVGGATVQVEGVGVTRIDGVPVKINCVPELTAGSWGARLSGLMESELSSAVDEGGETQEVEMGEVEAQGNEEEGEEGGETGDASQASSQDEGGPSSDAGEGDGGTAGGTQEDAGGDDAQHPVRQEPFETPAHAGGETEGDEAAGEGTQEPTLELGEAERIDDETGEGTQEQTLHLGEAERIDEEGGEGTQTLELGEAERIDEEGGEGTQEQTLHLGEAERIDEEGKKGARTEARSGRNRSRPAARR